MLTPVVLGKCGCSSISTEGVGGHLGQQCGTARKECNSKVLPLSQSPCLHMQTSSSLPAIALHNSTEPICCAQHFLCLDFSSSDPYFLFFNFCIASRVELEEKGKQTTKSDQDSNTDKQHGLDLALLVFSLFC